MDSWIQRRLPFEGTGNFRELGGYVCAGGRRVKQGVFYRGTALAELESENDRKLLESLGLKLVLDFRSKGEAAWYGPDPEVPGARMVRVSAINLPDGGEVDFSPDGMAALEEKYRRLGIDIEAWFQQVYDNMPFHNPAYQFLFKELEAGTAPILFHCSAGKDRTGIGAILILLALGADEQTAMEDYLLTNHCNKERIDGILRENEEYLKEHPEQYDYLVRDCVVARENAQGTLNTIKERYGTYEAFFEEEFGLDASRLERLREMYLEKD